MSLAQNGSLAKAKLQMYSTYLTFYEKKRMDRVRFEYVTCYI